ncbi:hypothetical protein H5410_041069 [Solanum commersonii]|uniref:40S ribosomal protein S7 n=1 Tax=Solanum commersonii TaxID=4109 RepID=A0A9J5XQK2_SOLCO|nr:hypothetical protein H5410_041069 [Solanum commersonii]
MGTTYGSSPPKILRGSLGAQRPRSRTLSSLHDAILEDLVVPAEIVGKYHVGPKYKLETFSTVNRKLSGKDVVFEWNYTLAVSPFHVSGLFIETLVSLIKTKNKKICEFLKALSLIGLSKMGWQGTGTGGRDGTGDFLAGILGGPGLGG